MTHPMIGAWVMRERYHVAHLAESIVAGDVVTRCGRRMTDEPTRDGGAIVASPSGTRQCRTCTPQED